MIEIDITTALRMIIMLAVVNITLVCRITERDRSDVRLANIHKAQAAEWRRIAKEYAARLAEFEVTEAEVEQSRVSRWN